MTMRFERDCLRETFGHVRAFLNLATRRPRERPTSFRQHTVDFPFDNDLGALNIGEQNLATADLAVLERPVILILPIIPEREVLSTERTPFIVTGISAKILHNPPDNPIKPDTLYFSDNFRIDSLIQMVAKIAHASAVALLGYGAADWKLPPAIFEPGRFTLNLIGSCPARRPKWASLHRVDIYCLNGKIIARVQLFARFSMPIFEVLVGNALFRLPGFQWRIL